MSLVPGISPVPGRFNLNAVQFDGTNDYLVRGAGLTGAADTKVGIMSVWLDMAGGDGSVHTIFRDDINGLIQITRTTGNKLSLRLVDPTITIVSLELVTTTNIVAASGWQHICAAWNVGAAYAKIFVNGADDTGSPTINNANVDWTRPDFAVGGSAAGVAKLNANVAQLYLNTSETIDLAANISKFILDGNPVDMGSDGALVTGTAPRVFLDGPTANWHTNKGTGGGFTENGALTDAATLPSD